MDEKEMWRPQTPQVFGYQPAFQGNGSYQAHPAQGAHPHPVTFQGGAWPGPMYNNPPPTMPHPAMVPQYPQATHEPQQARTYNQPSRQSFNQNQGPRQGYPTGKGDRGASSGSFQRGQSAPRRGRGGYGPPQFSASSHAQEKVDGRKSAIAETVAMMNKMKLEEQMRTEAAKAEKAASEAARSEKAAGEAEKSQPSTEKRDQNGNQQRFKDKRNRGGNRQADQDNSARSDARGGGGGGQGYRGRGGRGGPGGPQNSGANSMACPPFPGNDISTENVPQNPGQSFPNNNNGRDRQANRRGFGRQPGQGDFNGRGGGGGRGRGRGAGGRGSNQRQQRNNDPPTTDDVVDAAVGAKDVSQRPEKPSKNSNSGQGALEGQLALSASNGSISRSNKSKDQDLRESLIQQLVSGQYDCMICLDKIRPTHATWDCKQCYKVFHITCIRKWSKSAATAETQSKDSTGWRCPGCQFVTSSAPTCVCFCGKVPEPAYSRNEVPHTCGETCGRDKKRMNPECPHKCTELCHPGPCPPCTASIVRTCPCGKSKKTVKCGNPVDCDKICDKQLNCGEHKCKSVCHVGDCDDCDVVIGQTCFCPQENVREVVCGTLPPEVIESGGFSCDKPCQKTLSCGNHHCQEPCHPGPCDRCDRDTDVVDRCPCDKVAVSELGVDRKTCLDPIPTCGDVCDKKLTCGPVGNNHRCREKCHTGPCPPCPLTTKVLCRCGAMDKEIPCEEMTSRADDAVCEKRCTKKRSCGKHKCGNKCCIDLAHNCTLTCGKTLSCGLHRCTEFCHTGNCSVCPNVSFDELRCHCGTSVTYPPVHCGTKPPPCNEPCRRRHACDHDVRHNCHSDVACPPCTVLTEKWCYGKHEKRKNIACHLDGIFCGRPCGIPLPCGRHSCNKPCHLGKCLDEAKQEKCSQRCVQVRAGCGHPCNAPCHDCPCPNTPCAEKVKLSCVCGHLSQTTLCSQNESEYRRIQTSLLASKMSNLQYAAGSGSIELNDLWPQALSSKNGSAANKQVLECNEECAKLERNRRLALALQIENPELSSKLAAPKYSEFLKDFAKKDLSFAQSIHDKLAELIKLAKESKQKSRSYSFDVMNREKRQFVHEYSDHFGVTTESFDNEPKRNVVATAYKDKSWLPSQSIVDVVQNARKALGPVSLTSKAGPMSGAMMALQPMPKSTKAAAGDDPVKSEEAKKPIIDYFDD